MAFINKLGDQVGRAVQNLHPASLTPSIIAAAVVIMLGIFFTYSLTKGDYWKNMKCKGQPCTETDAPSKWMIRLIAVPIVSAIALAVAIGVYQLAFFIANPKIAGAEIAVGGLRRAITG